METLRILSVEAYPTEGPKAWERDPSKARLFPNAEQARAYGQALRESEPDVAWGYEVRELDVPASPVKERWP